MKSLYGGQQDSTPLGMYGVYTKLICRFLQFVLGLTMFGIYTADLVAAGHHGAGPNSAWVLASMVGAMSALIALTYLVPWVHSYLFFFVDWILVILHAGVIGVFANAYIAHGEVPTGNTNDTRIFGPNYGRERSAAFVDIISGCLWFMTAVMSTLIYLKVQSAKKRANEAMDV